MTGLPCPRDRSHLAGRPHFDDDVSIVGVEISVSEPLTCSCFRDGSLTRSSECAADSRGAELDPAEKARDDDDALEICAAQQLEQFHPRTTDLAVVACLLDQTVVLVPNPARPTVVTSFPVLGAAFTDHLLGFIEGRSRRRQREEAGALLGDTELGGGGDARHGEMMTWHVGSRQLRVDS